MKKDFSHVETDVAYSCKDTSEQRHILHILSDMGVPVDNEIDGGEWDGYLYIYWDGEEMDGKRGERRSGDGVDLSTFLAAFRNHPDTKIKLNSKHTAEIIDGKVKVGCAVFEFGAIEELYEAIQDTK